MSERTVYRADVLVTLDADSPVRTDAAFAVASGRIAWVGPADAPEAQGAQRLTGWVMPGLRNGHGHTAGWPPDAALELFLLSRFGRRTPEQTYHATLGTGLALLRSGVTRTHDLHYSRNDDAALDAYEALGVRVDFTPGALDRFSVLPYDDGNQTLLAHLPPDLAQEVRERRPGKPVEPVEEYLVRWERLRARESELVTLVIGADNPQWCTDAQLRALRAVGAPLHLHVQESPSQLHMALAQDGRSPIRRLADLGVLAPDVTLAHFVHRAPGDVELVAEAGASVVLNTSSNLRLGSGLSDPRPLRARGIPLGLGADGSGFSDDCSMLDEVRLAAHVQRALPPLADAPALTDAEILRAGVGAPLAPGEPADFVTLDPLPGEQDPIAAIVARGRAAHVRDVHVGGRRVLRDGVPVGVDQADCVYPEPAPLDPLAARLAPYVRRLLG